MNIKEDKKLIEITEFIDSISSLDFSKELKFNNPEDPFDAIAYGLNMLKYELKTKVDRKKILEDKNRKLETALKELSDYKYALDISTIVFLIDDKGIIRSVNKKVCEISKYSREELIGQNYKILNSGYHSKSYFVNLWKTIKSGKVWKGEIKNSSKDGIHYWVNETIIPFINKKKKPYRYLVIEHDVTSQKEKNLKLEHTQNELEESIGKLEKFAYTVSHDLKSPINSALGLITLIKKELDDINSENNKVYLDLLENILQQMRELVLGILEYSGTSSMVFSKEYLDLNTELKKIEEIFRCRENLILNIEEYLPVIYYNPIALRRIFINLIGNSIKHHNKSNINIKVTVRDKNNFYFVSIIDNGPGIPVEYHSEIFKLFNKIKTTKGINSTGIGLATVKKIVEESGGKIFVESKENEGAIFTFTIPKV